MGIRDFGVGIYSPRVAARIARIRYQNFQAWAKANLIHGERVTIGKRAETTYTYTDLLLLRLTARLRAEGARTAQIKTALRTVALLAGNNRDAWMKSMLLWDKESRIIVAFLPDKPDWDPIAASLGPQKMAVIFFPKLIQELHNELVPPERFPHIEIDPMILGGVPVVKGTRISTRAIRSVRDSGENPIVAYPSLEQAQVDNAVAYEEFLAA